MHVEIKASARGKRHLDASRSTMQLPRPFHVAVGTDASAASARAQAAFHAAQPNATRAGVNVDISTSRQVRLNFSAACSGVKRRRN